MGETTTGLAVDVARWCVQDTVESLRFQIGQAATPWTPCRICHSGLNLTLATPTRLGSGDRPAGQAAIPRVQLWPPEWGRLKRGSGKAAQAGKKRTEGKAHKAARRQGRIQFSHLFASLAHMDPGPAQVSRAQDDIALDEDIHRLQSQVRG